MNKKSVIQNLLGGVSVSGYKEGGNSMSPLIKHRQPIDLAPVDATKLEKGDIVMVKVRGRIYTHKVVGLRHNQVQIGNNHGKINGWTGLHNVYGIVVSVDGREISRSLSKVRVTQEE